MLAQSKLVVILSLPVVELSLKITEWVGYRLVERILLFQGCVHEFAFGYSAAVDIRVLIIVDGKVSKLLAQLLIIVKQRRSKWSSSIIYRCTACKFVEMRRCWGACIWLSERLILAKAIPSRRPTTTHLPIKLLVVLWNNWLIIVSVLTFKRAVRCFVSEFIEYPIIATTFSSALIFEWMTFLDDVSLSI